MVGSKCCDFKNCEVSNVNAPNYTSFSFFLYLPPHFKLIIFVNVTSFSLWLFIFSYLSHPSLFGHSLTSLSSSFPRSLSVVACISVLFCPLLFASSLFFLFLLCFLQFLPLSSSLSSLILSQNYDRSSFSLTRCVWLPLCFSLSVFVYFLLFNPLLFIFILFVAFFKVSIIHLSLFICFSVSHFYHLCVFLSFFLTLISFFPSLAT